MAVRAELLTKANVQGAPDLAIEILSDSTRRKDETLKRDKNSSPNPEELSPRKPKQVV